ncbi:MAG TPA: TraR/DksA C4-type zinc finger protein [Chitinophagaceae bacterium]|nr:TraR/DksA C4-type zinc finger protein [Chitinophagaceae bacterium]
MAIKKGGQKKQIKPAKPVKKAPVKKSSASKKTKPVPKKAVSKKPAHVVKKTAPKKSMPILKKVAKPVKPAPKKVTTSKSAKPVKRIPVPEKKPMKKITAKAEPPVKKPAVVAKSQQEVKPAIKPLDKPVAKKEPSKPFVIPKTSTNKSVKYQPDFMKSVLDAPSHSNQGPTQRYSDAELNEFKELIQRKLDTAKKELAYLQGLITRKDESGDLDEGRYMTMEDGSMSMEREQLSQMASRQIQFTDHLEKAIMRIENKTYGICRVTGKLIDKARLRAVPHATLSIEAKQRMSK